MSQMIDGNSRYIINLAILILVLIMGIIVFLKVLGVI